ncbi:uridine diphosphate-N-acetylglucosamine-binding protein YvcK [Pasteurellaceae bacterium LIM206]|nr:uridine diphosphate-N-acetylglucosamine-binding protein YvcK [Pasteurellaceae bacterium LIM206]
MARRPNNYNHIRNLHHIVAIGGGHGLGRVMSALSFMQEKLSGIVATTDNGGSTGRIRLQQGGIAWGDLRNCLTQIIARPTTASAVFEYRFSGTGDLAGHNLGNLILAALADMQIRPTEAINLIRNFLRVRSYIMPMSDTPVDLGAVLKNGEFIVGEVDIDHLYVPPASLYLAPKVKATQEAVEALRKAELVLIGPGSFLTSIMPPLLLDEVAETLRQSQAIKIFIDNLALERSAAGSLTIYDRVEWIHKTVGADIIDGVITQPKFLDHGDRLSRLKVMARELNAEDCSYRHDRNLLCRAIDDLVAELTQT